VQFKYEAFYLYLIIKLRNKRITFIFFVSKHTLFRATKRDKTTFYF